MKGFLPTLSLIACLFIASGCEGTVGKLMSGIRNGWDRLHGKGGNETSPLNVTEEDKAKMAKVEDLPGEPLSERDKLALVKAQEYAEFALQSDGKTPGPDKSPAHLKAMNAKSVDFTKDFPLLPVISQQEAEAFLKSPFPKELVIYQSGGKRVYPLKKKLVWRPEAKNYETLYLNILFEPNPYYFYAYAEFESPEKKPARYYVLDRGGIPEWVRTVRWYNQRKGITDAFHADIKFVGTEEDVLHDVTWAKYVSQKDGATRYFTLWQHRFEVIVEGAPLESLESVIDVSTLDRLSEGRAQ